MARKRNRKGFTLIEVLVAISILGMLMSGLMVAFNTTVNTVNDMQDRSEMMQNLRSASEQLHRELTQAILNNNRPDGEQVYFQIKQLSENQSVLRFGCTTDRGLLEVAYQIKEAFESNGNPRWRDYEMWRLNQDEKMWNYHGEAWPAIDFESSHAEPFAFGLVGFKVKYWSTQKSKWIAGNWDSFERATLPRKIQIILTAVPMQLAKQAKNVEDIFSLKGVETMKLEISLPQSR